MTVEGLTSSEGLVVVGSWAGVPNTCSRVRVIAKLSCWMGGLGSEW